MIVNDFESNLDGSDCTVPHGSHGIKPPSFTICTGNVQERASANDAMVLFEYSLLFVHRLTVLFVPAVFTLDMVVAEELLFETDLPSGPSPISCRAHQIVLFLTASSTWGPVDLMGHSCKTGNVRYGGTSKTQN